MTATVTRPAVVTLPRRLGSADRARSLVRGSVQKNTSQVVVNAFDEQSVAPDAADELIRNLAEVGVEHVVVVNATEGAERQLQRAHLANTNAESAFLLTFQNRDASILYRNDY